MEEPTFVQSVSEDAHEQLVRGLEKSAAKLTGLRTRDEVKGHNSLCYSCKYASIRRTARDNDPIVICEASHPNPRVYGEIVECSDYRTFTSMDLDQMARIATIIDSRDHLKEGYR